MFSRIRRSAHAAGTFYDETTTTTPLTRTHERNSCGSACVRALALNGLSFGSARIGFGFWAAETGDRQRTPGQSVLISRISRNPIRPMNIAVG